jgi:hypothetical protein
MRTNAPGLLDQDPATQGGLQLLGEEADIVEGPMLEDRDRRGVGERLGNEHVLRIEGSGIGTEEIERPDDLLAETDRQGMNRAIAGVQRDRDESWPAAEAPRKVLVDHGLAGAEAVQAGSFPGLKLKQFNDSQLVGRRRQDPQGAVGCGEEQPGGRGVEELDAAFNQRLGHVDDVEVVHKGVRQLQKRSCK